LNSSKKTIIHKAEMIVFKREKKEEEKKESFSG